MDSILSILRQNGYPDVIINSTISKKIARFCEPVNKGPQKYLVYLKLPWIGNISLRFDEQVKSNVQNFLQLFNPALSSKRARVCPYFTRMLCPPHNKAWSYTNTCVCGGGDVMGMGDDYPNLPRDGGAEELRGDPTIRPLPKVRTIDQE